MEILYQHFKEGLGYPAVQSSKHVV